LSVINKMLNDLQDRQGEDVNAPLNRNAPSHVNASPYKSILMIILTVVVTLAVVYVFYLQQENKKLLIQTQAITVTATQPLHSRPVVVEQSIPTDIIWSDKAQFNKDNVAPVTSNNISQQPRTPVTQPHANQQHVIQTAAAETHEAHSPEILITPKHQQALATPQTVNAVNDLHPVATDIKHNKNPYGQSISTDKNAAQKAKNETASVSNIDKSKSGMSITRHQLAPETLAKQKMSRAKEALANNQITKAETLFEDVLLILPTHKDARKQLAALWFGRQSYQAANNLLAQGIYLDPIDKSLRQLNAQVFIKQNNHQAAFDTLKTLPRLEHTTDIKYLTILAAEAQVSKNFSAASKVYTKLSQLRPNEGRWALGIAIAYDSNSEFLLAKKMYQQAYHQQNLSISAKQFIKNRLKELGE
jgi:MSHA biogenesis protein MshN